MAALIKLSQLIICRSPKHEQLKPCKVQVQNWNFKDHYYSGLREKINYFYNFSKIIPKL